MGRRGSSDRLEALSLEIERKLQKVTHRFPRVRWLGSARRARCSDFAAPVVPVPVPVLVS